MAIASVMVTNWGAFAIVSYVPQPLGSALDRIRLSVPGRDRSQAHITIVPPRELTVPKEDVSAFSSEILARFQSFEVELESIQLFPATNVLYLNLGAGNSFVRDLHEQLNQGCLADHEQFEFHPHLTLGGPIEAPQLEDTVRRTIEAWERVVEPKRFLLTEVVGLWAEDGLTDATCWQRIWTYQLPSSAALGKGVGASTGRTF